MTFETCAQLMNHTQTEAGVASAVDVKDRWYVDGFYSDLRPISSHLYEAGIVLLLFRAGDLELLVFLLIKGKLTLYFSPLFFGTTAGACDKLQITAAIIDLTDITLLRQITLSSFTLILQSLQHESR